MDSMDTVRERFAALERQMQVMGMHIHKVEQQLRWWRIPWSVAAVVALGLALALPLTGQATIFHCGGEVPCLIAAINDANANGQKNTIRLEAGTYTLTAPDNPNNGLPVITSTLTITGQGAETTIIERGTSASGAFRILAVAATGTLTLKRLTLRGGVADGGGGILNSGSLTLMHTMIANNRADIGGGISTIGPRITIAHSIIADNLANQGAGGLAIRQGTATFLATTVTRNASINAPGGILTSPFFGANPPLVFITESTIDHNRGAVGQGGGIRNSGTLVITNTTFAANGINSPPGAGPAGGGIANSGTVLLTNSTLAENTAGILVGVGRGGGIGNEDTGTVLLVNTILARNAVGSGPASSGPDCSGTITSLGTNLIGDPTGCTITLGPSDLTGDPGLDAFTDNGRPGHGHFPLLPTSQAIDAGSDALCPRTDQLGRLRIGPCDIGAIEFRHRDDRQHDEEDDHHDMDLATAAD